MKGSGNSVLGGSDSSCLELGIQKTRVPEVGAMWLKNEVQVKWGEVRLYK